MTETLSNTRRSLAQGAILVRACSRRVLECAAQRRRIAAFAFQLLEPNAFAGPVAAISRTPLASATLARTALGSAARLWCGAFQSKRSGTLLAMAVIVPGFPVVVAALGIEPTRMCERISRREACDDQKKRDENRKMENAEMLSHVRTIAQHS
jgi:hypothetical protein